jgi:antitoxin MazE
MRAQVAKWGHSLAVRIPAACARKIGLRVGDAIEIEAVGDELRLVPERPFDKAAFLAALDELHADMRMGEPIVPRMRGEARY